MIDELSAELGLFGREEDVRVMGDVVVGGGSAVAIGDPGVGKSSLLKVADHLAQRRGHRVLSVTPTQFDRGLPFSGLVELIAQCPEGVDEGLPGPQQRALAVALHREEPTGDVDALAVPIAVRGLLTHLCSSGPLALIIDDLQWLDQASVGSLGFALRRVSVERDRLSVLVATRPEGSDSDLVRCLPEPRYEYSLQPLDDIAIGQLLRNRLGPRWTPPMSAGVARASAGNPFLALMIAKAMQADLPTGHGPSHPQHVPVFPVPPTLADLLRERVMQLSPNSRDALLLVSAAGQLTLGQLQGIVDDARLQPALEAAADAGVATVSAEAAVTFTHPLLASAIYDAATPTERRCAHRLLGQTLDDPVERARHRARSITAPDESIAAELANAADISRSRGAPALAGELLEGAARATPTSVDAAGLARWLKAVDAFLAAGDGVAAQAALDEGSALASTSEQQAQVLVRSLRMVDHFSGVRSLAEEAVRLAPQGSEIRAEILSILGLLHRMQGHGDEALEYSRLAVEEASAVGRSDVQLEALNNLMAVQWHWAAGPPQQTLNEIEQLVESAALDPNALWVVWSKGFFATWNDETAEKHVRDGIAAAVKDGRYGDLSYMYICLVLILIRGSRVREAQAALDESDRLGAWAGSSLQEDMARILVKEYAGDLDGARDLAQRAVDRSRASGSTYWIAGFMAQVGFIETSARNWQAALEVFRELADIFDTTKMLDLEQLLWGADYADVALQVGAYEDVERAIAVLRRQGSAGRPEALVAADRYEALMRAAGGELDQAVIDLRRIVDQPGIECPFEAARTRLALGQTYRRAGQRSEAKEILNAAATAFEDLGNPRWAERARDEAGRAGSHPITGVLTPSERNVAQLVGAGRSNQEVAAELFMSVKTVEANLTRIYRKLAVRSRTELANHMHQLGSAVRNN